MSATTIIDTAPLGALIRYTDGSPKPPARFTKKLAAWERSNGVGRLVKKEPPRAYPTWTAPASFTLHEGNFSSDGVILVTIMRSHSADSALVFEVAEEPKPGQVRVLLDFGGNTELLHLAESITAAELWIAKEGYRNARLEIVGDEEGERADGMVAALPRRHRMCQDVVFTATIRRGRQYYGYNDWCGLGKVCFSGTRSVDGG